MRDQRKNGASSGGEVIATGVAYMRNSLETAKCGLLKVEITEREKAVTSAGSKMVPSVVKKLER